MGRSSSLVFWVSLELNILRFIPLISSKGCQYLENTLKYFLIQSAGSAIFLFMVLFSQYNLLIGEGIIFVIILKLGGAPFHGWFLSMLINSSIWIYYFLATVQKFIPILILSSFYCFFNLISFHVFLNFLVIVGSGISSLNLTKILGLSSLNRLSWMLRRILGGMKFFVFFIFVYIVLLLGVILIFSNPLKITFLQISSIGFVDKFSGFFMFLSLGGVPPFLGFLGKVIILKVILLKVGIEFIILIIFSSLIVLFYYLSFIYLRMTLGPNLIVKNKFYSIPMVKSLYFLRMLGIWGLILLYI